MKKMSLFTSMALMLTVLNATSCREPDGPLSGVNGSLEVSSDPEGAHIFVDDNDTGLRTPTTVPDIGGSHDVTLLLDTLGYRYLYGAHVIVQGIEPFKLSGPLTARCGATDVQVTCYRRNRAELSAGNITVSMNALGAMMLEDGNGQGVLWPAGTNESYVSNAMPLMAAKTGGRAVALGVYDVATLAGRPAPSFTVTNGELHSDQRTWVVPTSTSTSLTTIRGIEIREQVLIDPTVPDVMLIKLTYKNITNSPLYQKLDARGSALAASQGLTYDEVYLGFGMDADIGTASDDIMTYDPELHAVITYDANFNDSNLNSGSASKPGLVGLRMLSAPSGAKIILNGYGAQSGGSGSTFDWHASQADEATGWAVMSGTNAYAPDDPDPTIGMVLTGESDVRMLVSAGPYALRPAEEITIVVAVAFASPVPGSFTPAVAVAPGSPHDGARAILSIAGDLRAKLVKAETLLAKIGH